MKKTLIPFLLAGVLSTTSCTESFEPTVDYGDQTHINDYSALLAAVNNLNKSMNERFDALNLILEKNLADIKLSIDANTGAIKVLGSSVDNIDKTLFNGFSALSTQIDATGKQIIFAINENGELLRLQIDENGKLISSKIEEVKASINVLVGAINSQTTTLGQKFDALNALVKEGFADVIAKIGAVGDQLHLDIKETNTALGKLDADMLAGFTMIEKKLEASGNSAIIDAINANGDKLQLAIDNNGKVISGKIEDFHDDYTTKEAAELAKMGEILDAINALKAANNANAATIIAQLKELLAKNQIYTTDNPQELYMSPDKFQQIEEGGKGSNIYNHYLSLIDMYMPVIDKRQVINEAGFEDPNSPFGSEGEIVQSGTGVNVHAHAVFTDVTPNSEMILIAGEPKVEDFSNGLKVVKVRKTALSCKYKVHIDSGEAQQCSYLNIYKVKLVDLEGIKFINSTGAVSSDFEMNGATTAQEITFELKIYDKATDTVADDIKAFVYCSQRSVGN